MKNLKTLSFSIQIHSTKQHIWEVLWNPETYEKWSHVFMEGSHYKGELKQGSTICFLGKNGNGMSSIIEKMIENEQMVFSHQKEIKNGVEIDSTWQGVKEIYNLKKESNTTTVLRVSMEVIPEMEAYLNSTFPKALERIKELSLA